MRQTKANKTLKDTSSYHKHHADEWKAESENHIAPKSFPTSSTSTNDLTTTPIYYTSGINEGIANVEEITECDPKEYTENTLNDNETYIATKLSYNILEAADNENETLPFSSTGLLTSPHGNIYDDIGELFSDQSEEKSDSDSEFELSFEYSSNDDEITYTSKLGNITPPNKGNLPLFERLDVDSTFETTISPTSHPLRFRSMPTATAVRESPVSESYYFHTPVTSDGRFFSTGDADRDKRKSAISAAISTSESYKESEGNATYCSTKVQTKLLSKLTKSDTGGNAHDNMITHSNFPELQFVRSSLKKKSKLPLKHFTGFNEEPKVLGGSYRKTFEKDVGVDLQNFETEVDKALAESVSEGSFMPLLKQELQCKIQVKRLSRGEPELVLEPEEPKTYELTAEEIEKKNARLDQNRRSARKSRTKARIYERKLLKTIKNEMEEHARLSKEVEHLKNEKNKYKRMHDDHVKSCTRYITQ